MKEIIYSVNNRGPYGRIQLYFNTSGLNNIFSQKCTGVGSGTLSFNFGDPSLTDFTFNASKGTIVSSDNFLGIINNIGSSGEYKNLTINYNGNFISCNMSSSKEFAIPILIKKNSTIEVSNGAAVSGTYNVFIYIYKIK